MLFSRALPGISHADILLFLLLLRMGVGGGWGGGGDVIKVAENRGR